MNIEEIINFCKSNQFLITGLGLGGAGVLTFWIKDLPLTFWAFIKRTFTTELFVTSQNLAFYDILNYIEKHHGNKNFRKLKITNGKWGYEEKSTTSIGYGYHYIFYKKCIFLIGLMKEVANQSANDKETISIRKFGRNRKILDEFIQESLTKIVDVNKIELYKSNKGNWNYIKKQNKRNINSVFIEKDKKDKLISMLEKFINSEKWYVDNGIPYQLGILLYGEPGTGKTSLIKAISGYLNYNIYYLPAGELNHIETAMSALPNKSMIIIEDIDSNFITKIRTDSNNIVEKDNDFIESMASIGLSEILNALDGMFSAHGRILITTTNHIKNLDPALIRPGRIDLKIEIGYVNIEILKDFMNNFFPNNNIDFKNLRINKNITIAELQNMVLQELSQEEIINYVEN